MGAVTRRPTRLAEQVAGVVSIAALVYSAVAIVDNGPSDDSAYPAPIYLPAVVRDAVPVRVDPVQDVLARRREVHTSAVAGFGRAAGSGMEQWVVETADSAKRLESLLGASGGMVVILAADVKLSRPIAVASDKALLGDGNVTISGHGLQLRNVSNVVVGDIAIRDVAGDAIEISGSTDVWLDRLSLSRAGDGLVDIVRSSGDVTLSGSHLFDHTKVMLVGADNSHTGDTQTRVSILGNTFGPNVGIRLPSVRFAEIESRDNLRTGWTGGTAIDLRMGARFFSCGDRWASDEHNRTRVTTNSGAVYTECGQ